MANIELVVSCRIPHNVSIRHSAYSESTNGTLYLLIRGQIFKKNCSKSDQAKIRSIQ